MMRRTACWLLAGLLLSPAAFAAGNDITDGEVAVKAARIETLRARLSTVSSPTASGTLIEAENLLRQLRAAPQPKRGPLAAQLDAALTRADLEVDAAQRGPR